MQTIGILGGGQLAKMISIAAAKLAFKTNIYCEHTDEPALQCCNQFTIGKFSENKKLEQFAKQVDYITIETENIDPEALRVVKAHSECHICPDTIAKIQNRLQEKQLINSFGVRTAQFSLINNASQLKHFAQKVGMPLIIKSIKCGYDGKGQQLIDDLDSEIALSYPFIAEEFIRYKKEISILCARDYHEESVFFPIAENIHKGGILITSTVPAGIHNKLQNSVHECAKILLKSLNFIGLLAIEFFVDENDEIIVNEIAPRPHNSAHWSIDACNISQFEQLVRIICGIPMKKVHLLAKCTTKNLLGSDILQWRTYCSLPNMYPMVYGKSKISSRRKMGHVNILAQH